MASQVLNEREVESPHSFLLRDVCAGGVLEPSEREARVLTREADFHSESSAEDGSPVKGILVAMAVQAVLALGIYGIWEVWRLFR